MKKINRRDILKLGTATMGLPWLEYFAASDAFAAGEVGKTADGLPKRLCVVFSSLGTIPNEWVNGNSGNYELGKILKPLASYKDKMTIVRGLWQTGENGAHPGAQAGALTGRRLEGNKDTSNNVAGPSFDQRIASQISSGLPRRSLHMSLNVFKAISHKGSNQPVMPLTNPYQAFDQYFSGVRPGGSSGTPTREDQLNIAREQLLKDTRARYRELRNRVGMDDKARLEQHLDSLNELINRLELQNKPSDSSEMSACQLPVLGTHNKLPDNGGNFSESGSDDAKNNAINRTYMDITAQAFACNVSRVSVLGLGDYHAHGGESHKANVNNRNSNPDAYDAVVQAGVHAANNIKYLVDALSAIPEGRGSVMDNTLIYWAYELADGAAHSSEDARHLLIGNAGGAFDMGRLIDVPANRKQPHNELLTSMINCFGIPDENFGEFRWHGNGRFSPLNVSV